MQKIENESDLKDKFITDVGRKSNNDKIEDRKTIVGTEAPHVVS